MLDANADSMELSQTLGVRLGSLHSAPHVGHKLLDITRTCNFSLAEIVSCLECDPASAIRLLTAANAQHTQYPVDSLPIAVNLLGRRASRKLALSFTFHPQFSKGVGRSFFDAYRQRTLLTMAAAQRLSVISGLVEPDRARCAAILMDGGMLLLAHEQPKKYARAYRECTSSTALLRWEQATFGFDHQVLGAQLVRAMGMPEPIQTAIARHHSHEVDGGPLELVLRGASHLAELVSSKPSGDSARARAFLKAGFGIHTDQLISLALECQNDGLLEWDMLEWELDEETDCDQLMESARQLLQIDPSYLNPRRDLGQTPPNARPNNEDAADQVGIPSPQAGERWKK